MLNCRPNDIAVIVNSKSRGGMLNGCMLRCIAIAHTDYWIVEPLSERLRNIFATEGEGTIWDKRLRPIHPGDVTDSEVIDLYRIEPITEDA